MENAERLGVRAQSACAGANLALAVESGQVGWFRSWESYRKVWANRGWIEPAGKSALPSARTNTMSIYDITRRKFIQLSGAVAATALIGVSCDGGSNGDGQPGPEGTVEVYKLSLRGRRGSRAAKAHNANKLFLTPQAADQNRAHPGDNSRIVSIRLSEAKFNELFIGGGIDVVDLRAIP